MGQRANYLIIDKGGHELFYSHWAANSVERDFFWGPAQAERFVRAQEPTAEWLDDVWCEGGAVLDKDLRELSIFGGEDIEYDLYLRATWLTLVQPLWPGWTIRWAPRGILELAQKAAVPASCVLTRRSQYYVEELRASSADDPWCQTLVTLPGLRYTLSTDGEAVLRCGPDLLRALSRIQQPARIDASPPGAGLCLDPATRTLRYWYAKVTPNLEATVLRSWAGWSVVRNDDDFAEHLSLLTEFRPPLQDEVLQGLADSLMGEYRSPVEGVLSLLADKQTKGHVIEVNPHVLVDGRADLTPQEKTDMLTYAVQQYRALGGASCYRQR